MKLVGPADPILSETCAAVDFTLPGAEYAALVREMGGLMLRHRGVGLAAPQVGLPLRLFVMRYGMGTLACFNPVTLDGEGCATAAEGCLSFPGLQVAVARPSKVRAAFFDATGKSHLMNLSGIAARVYQHELDHLNGKTIRGVAAGKNHPRS